jgi:hypothetical protein
MACYRGSVKYIVADLFNRNVTCHAVMAVTPVTLSLPVASLPFGSSRVFRVAGILNQPNLSLLDVLAVRLLLAIGIRPVIVSRIGHVLTGDAICSVQLKIAVTGSAKHSVNDPNYIRAVDDNETIIRLIPSSLRSKHDAALSVGINGNGVLRPDNNGFIIAPPVEVAVI